MARDFNPAKIPDRKSGVRYLRHPEYPYIFGSDGSAYSIYRPRWRNETGRVERAQYLKIGFMRDKDGYCMMSLRKNGVLRRGRVHVLILETFVGPRPSGAWALHANDIKDDNRLSNLRWDLPACNYRDREKNGTSYVGARNPAAKLTAEQVLQIRAEKPFRGYIPKLASRYGVSKPLITKIRARKVWAHLP